MAYETKVMLMMLADLALTTDSKKMYEFIATYANVEGIALPNWDEAKKKLENET